MTLWCANCGRTLYQKADAPPTVPIPEFCPQCNADLSQADSMIIKDGAMAWYYPPPVQPAASMTLVSLTPKWSAEEIQQYHQHEACKAFLRKTALEWQAKLKYFAAAATAPADARTCHIVLNRTATGEASAGILEGPPSEFAEPLARMTNAPVVILDVTFRQLAEFVHRTLCSA